MVSACDPIGISTECLFTDVAIPTVAGGTNHTPEFTKSTATPEAHKATLNVAKALAAVGFRVLHDDDFYEEVSASTVSLRYVLTTAFVGERNL